MNQPSELPPSPRPSTTSLPNVPSWIESRSPGVSFLPSGRSSARFGWSRIALAIVVAAGTLAVLAQPQAWLPRGVAQDAAREESLEPDAAERPAAARTPAASSAAAAEPTLLDLFWASGTIGIIICLSSIVALGFTVEHALTIRPSRIMPPDEIEQLDQLIATGQVEAALEYVQQPERDSLICHVTRAGLERYRNSEFGFAEYRAAVEEAGEDYTSKLYRKTEALNVIGAIAPMLGLLGTVQGMILAFNTIASRGGMARPDELAGSISLALVTTFEGLVVAIPAMVAFSYFRNKIDSLVAEAGKRVEQLLAPLGRQRARS